MGEVLGLPLPGAIAAFGWAAARVLMDGFAGAAGGWLFPTIACVAGLWAFSAQIAEGDAYLLFKHIAAIAAAAVLLYAPVRTDLSAVVNGRIGGFGFIDVNQGAAPIPTQLIDWMGTAITGAAKQMLVGADQQILPMLDQALSDAASDRASYQDGQIAMNVATWRMLLSSALLSDPSAAAALDGQGLRERALNPVPADARYSGATAAQDAQNVLNILQSLSAPLGETLCRNAALVADLAGTFGAVPWTPARDCAGTASGAVAVLIVSATTRQSLSVAAQTAPTSDAASQARVSRAAAVLQGLFSTYGSAINAGSFTDWGSLYRSLAAATLVGAAAQLARDVRFKSLLGASCAAYGNDYCAGTFAASAQAMSQYVANRDPHSVAPWYERVWQWFDGSEPGSGPVAMIAAAVASLVSVLFKLMAQMVASLTPYALAAARAVAVLLAVLGIYLLLIPGRTRDAIGLMVGPIAWVHIWTLLFIVWYPLETAGSQAAGRLPLAGATTGTVAARAVVRFVFAAGYASLPYVAWKIVFGGLSRTVPRLPLDRLVAPARNYVTGQIRKLLPRDSRSYRRGGGSGAGAYRGTGHDERAPGAPPAPGARRRRLPSNAPSAVAGRRP